MQIALGVLGFAVLGIDPMGAILVAAATATETRRGGVVAFLVAALLATVVAGTTLALAGRGLVESITSRIPGDDSSVWLAVNAIIITVIVGGLVRRFVRRNQPAKEKVGKRKLLDSLTQYAVAGVVFGVSSVTDPTLYGAVSIAAESDNIAAMAAASATWFLVSQFMLVAYVIGFLLGAHERLVAAAQRWWARQRDRFEIALYVAALGLVVVLLADTVAYASTGDYLLAF